MWAQNPPPQPIQIGGEMKIAKLIIQRQYIVSVKELRKIYGLIGEVEAIDLWEGRSVNEEEKGIKSDKDLYVITTKEIQ